MSYESALTLVQIVDVPGQVQLVVVSPDKRYLYAGVHPKLRVLAYSVTPGDGTLTFITEPVLPGSPTHISIDHQGQFVSIGSYNAGNVSVARLEDGLPMGVADMVGGLDGRHSVDISPGNHTLWVPALRRDRICLFTVSDDGHPVAQDPTEATTVEGASPRHMVFHPNEQYTYCVNELDSSVDVQELKDPCGNIECVQTLDMMSESPPGTCWAADIHVTPDGHHLYACDHTANLITVFSVSEDGSVLSKKGSQPTETQSRGFNVDHSGKYLIAAGQKSHHTSVYEIVGKQGLLYERGRYAVGQGPMWVVVNAYQPLIWPAQFLLRRYINLSLITHVSDV